MKQINTESVYSDVWAYSNDLTDVCIFEVSHIGRKIFCIYL